MELQLNIGLSEVGIYHTKLKLFKIILKILNYENVARRRNIGWICIITVNIMYYINTRSVA